jgi:hypothetical protein
MNMLKIIKIIGGITISAIGITSVAALGAVTARFVNKVVRECKQPFVPEVKVIRRPCSILIKRRGAETQKPTENETPDEDNVGENGEEHS